MKLIDTVLTMRDVTLVMETVNLMGDELDKLRATVAWQERQIAGLTENVQWMRTHMKVKNDVITAMSNAWASSLKGMLG